MLPFEEEDEFWEDEWCACCEEELTPLAEDGEEIAEAVEVAVAAELPRAFLLFPFKGL